MKISHDTSYCLRGWCESKGLVIGDLMEYGKIKNINFDILIDNNGLRKGMEILQKHFNWWYWHGATRLEKTRIFYKYLDSLKYDLEEVIIEFSAWFKENNNSKIDKRRNFMDVLLEVSKKPDTAESIVNVVGILKTALKKLRIYSKQCWYSLDHIMKLEYDEHMLRGQMSMNNMVSFNGDIGTTSTSTSTISFDGTSNGTYSTFGTGTGFGTGGTSQTIYVDSTTPTTVTYNNNNGSIQNLAVNGNTISNNYTDARIASIGQHLIPKKIDHRKIKKEKKQVRNIIKKSINGLKKFIPYSNIKDFISGGGFTITGPKYKWVIQKKEHYTVEKYSKILNSVHIPYELKLYTKEDEFLADLCVTFNGCPILDQILSTVLHIKSGDEDGLLLNCNFYSPSEKGLILKKAIRGNESTLEALSSQYVSNTPFGGTITGSGSVDGSTQTTAAEVISSSMLRTIKKGYAKEQEYQKTKEYIKKQFHKIFKTVLGPELFEFVINRHLSWDEMNDYYMMPDYKYEVLDIFVGKGNSFTADGKVTKYIN